MTEILFRGFNECKNGKEKAFLNGKWHKGKWVEGCYFMAKDDKYNILHCISEIKGEQIFKVVPETVGQYTGLSDKNGTKIFKGDIVRKYLNYSGENIYAVIEYKLGYYWLSFSKDAGLLLGDEHEKIEVIGNIHSNPELLEV